MSQPIHQITDVPNYGIYGHPYQKSAIDFLHIESLRDTQRIHDWTIRPHRHRDLTQFFFVEQGSGKIQLGEKESTIEAPCIIVIPANEIHAFNLQKDIDGYLITIADSFLRDLALMVREPLIETEWTSTMIVALNQSHYSNTGVSQLINDLIIEFNEKREARSVAIYAHLSLILTSIIRLVRANPVKSQHSSESKNLSVLRRFQKMCDDRYKNSKTVSEYCKDLNITERTLRRITQQYLGVPPLKVIHDRVLLEAQRNLIYSSASISSIAESIGFDDPAYFTRFFKRHTSQTPNQFRTSKWKSNQSGTDNPL